MAHDPKQLIARIRKIDRSEYEESALQQFDSWIRELEEFDAKRAYAEHFITKEYVAELKTEIAAIEDTLLNTRGLDKYERDLLLDKKTMYTRFVQRFEVGPDLEELARTIEESL